jgi:tetratricopeptide (TPR) repeat protein
MSLTERIRTDLEEYKKALDAVNFSEEKSKLENDLLTLLFCRDKLQKSLQSALKKNETMTNNTQLLVLTKEVEIADNKLRSYGQKIVSTLDLIQWRENMNIGKSYWWWHFEQNASIWYKFDWFWNTMTTVTLAISASFMINIYSAVSISSENFSVALSTIFQAMGLAVVGGGALSEKGREIVRNILGNFKLPPYFFAEATFAAGLMLLCLVYYINSNLDEFFCKEGIKSYRQGDLSSAQEALIKAQTLNPQSSSYNGKIGMVYESLGDVKTASQYYKKSVEDGNFEDLVSLGRAYINIANPITGAKRYELAESYLLIGMQRLQTYKDKEHLLYKVRTNMGWTLLNQNKLDRAKAYLEVAIERQKKLPELQTGNEKNMAYCFLAMVNEKMGHTKEAAKLWVECIDKAKPEFIHEYKWFIDIKKDKIAYCINTHRIVSGYQGLRNEYSRGFCQEVKDELQSMADQH